MSKPHRTRSEDYAVGWVCALPIELAAAREMLDEKHEDSYRNANDTNIYTLGRIGGHNVVIACLPYGQMGTNSAAAVAAQMKSAFTSIQFGLMVGIGGGVPRADWDIRLGDVVVSQPGPSHGGVVQYDFGKTTESGFERTGFLNSPPALLLNAITKLEANHGREKTRFMEYTSQLDKLQKFSRAAAGPDLLFEANYNHVKGDTCEQCDKKRLVERKSRGKEIMVHYGTIASGNQVMRDATERDRVSLELGGVLCFEMEAAGLMNHFPCLVIRGICDYADSHKNKGWQAYAAGTAAAYAKEVLSVIPAAGVARTHSTSDNVMAEKVREKTLSALNGVDLDMFLQMLSVINQEKHLSLIPHLDCDHPNFWWVFRNVDFTQWGCTSSKILWLSGPPERSIDRISSYVVNQEKIRALKSRHLVLYFFCSTAIRTESIVHTLLHQLVCYLPDEERRSIVRHFLFSLLLGALNRTEKREILYWQKACIEAGDYSDISVRKVIDDPKLQNLGFEENSPEEIREKILNVPVDELWVAFSAIISNQQIPGVVVVIDGLHNIQYQKGEVIRAVRSFVEQLQRKFSKAKILLTSLAQTDIKEMLCDLPYVEHDRERKECLASLRFDNTRFSKITKQHEGSFEWLWEHSQYKEWSLGKSSRLLYIQGKPGSGKSTLTRYLHDNILKREQASEPAIVAKFFYTDREGDLQKNHYNMLLSILYDILYQDENFFYHHFQKVYRHQATQRNHINRMVEWQYESLKDVLLTLPEYPVAKRLYLIIDALDESDVNDRRDIVQLLVDVCSKSQHSTVKVFVASRPVGLLEIYINEFHNFIRLQDHTQSDIAKFAGSFLRRIQLPGFQKQATEYIVENAQGVFLWVKLVGEELFAYYEEGLAEEDIFEFLRSLPTELENLYRHMLVRIDTKQKSVRDGIKMFKFVLYAYRPLTTDELLHTLGIRDNTIHSNSDVSFERRVPAERRITHCGGNFLEIREHDGTRIVQVMHQTVREFFLDSDGYVRNSIYRIDEKDSHKCICITCIQYLMLCAANTSLSMLSWDIKDWTAEHFTRYAQYLNDRPLADYALRYLKLHIDGCDQDADVLNRISLFINKLTRRESAYLLESWISSHLNNAELLDIGKRTSAENFRNQVLHAAVWNGFPTAVQVLLTVNTDPNAVDTHGRTPLSRAAERGHEPVVRSLLTKTEVVIDSEDYSGRTPLSWAAAGGHVAVVKLLTTAEADVDSQDVDGRTPLCWATEAGHQAVVKQLQIAANVTTERVKRIKRS